MAVTLKIDNWGSINIKEISQVDADASDGQANITLQSTQNVLANDFCVIGQLGTERAELKKTLTITNAKDIVLATNLSYDHARFENFTTLFGDKIKVYRAPNVDGSQPADSAFIAVGSTVDIDPDQMTSSFTDTGGSSDYWYKFTYYNSTTTSETLLSDSGAARGSNPNSYCSLDEIREEAGFQNNKFITDSLIDIKRQEAQSTIDSALTGVYTVPFVSPVNPLISQITRLLAAGYLLLEDYGPMTNMQTDNGQKKIDAAMALLDKLNTKKLVLTDASGADTSNPGTAGSFSGWPDETTEFASPDDGGAERLFRISDRY